MTTPYEQVIDRYLMDGTLTFTQHSAGEYLLKQAGNAGMFPAGADWSGTRVQNGKKDWSSTSSFQYMRTVKEIEKHLGWFHAWLVVEVVIHDWDVSEFPMRMLCLLEALDLIVERRLGGIVDPMDRLQIAAKKKEGAGFPTP
jgi:hypothetical protein